jgi:GDP-D-mannose dehydratase
MDKPDDYVLATGEAHSVREFLEKAFAHIRSDNRLARNRRRGEGPRQGERRDAGRGRPTLFPADRSGFSARSSEQSASQARLVAKNEL